MKWGCVENSRWLIKSVSVTIITSGSSSLFATLAKPCVTRHIQWYCHCNALYEYVNWHAIVTRRLKRLSTRRLALFQSNSGHVRDYLHWLHRRVRVWESFKIATLVYKAQNDIAPLYTIDLIVPSTTVIWRKGMRFSSKLTLIVLRHRKKSVRNTQSLLTDIWSETACFRIHSTH